MAVKIAKATKTEPTMTELAKQYLEYREQKKVIEDRMKVLATTLKEYAVSKGVKDSNGSSYIECDGYRVGIRFYHNSTCFCINLVRGYTLLIVELREHHVCLVVTL